MDDDPPDGRPGPDFWPVRLTGLLSAVLQEIHAVKRTLLWIAVVLSGFAAMATGMERRLVGQETGNAGGDLTPQQRPETAGPQPARQRKVKRAPRPQFSGEDSGSLFFHDLFVEALQGERPPSSGDRAQPEIAGSGSRPSGEERESNVAWSAIIPASVLEDEIKRQQIRLNGLVTNPGQFKTRNLEIRDCFQGLAMMFAIISQYDGQVRWKDQAMPVMTAMIGSANQARGTDAAAFANAKQTTQRLEDLVRGSAFGDVVETNPVDDWSNVIDRVAIMQRLDAITSGALKTATSSERDFSRDAGNLVHDAALVAAMGRILQLPEMDDADDEDYRALAHEMTAAGRAISEATIANDLDAAANGLNQLNQTCVRCHADWR
jgi:hypothetical protein